MIAYPNKITNDKWKKRRAYAEILHNNNVTSLVFKFFYLLT